MFALYCYFVIFVSRNCSENSDFAHVKFIERNLTITQAHRICKFQRINGITQNIHMAIAYLLTKLYTPKFADH
jgi:hypothetical protein